jgi:hypothetical protein
VERPDDEEGRRSHEYSVKPHAVSPLLPASAPPVGVARQP